MAVNRNESTVAIDECNDRANEGVVDVGKVRSEILCIPNHFSLSTEKRHRKEQGHIQVHGL